VVVPRHTRQVFNGISWGGKKSEYFRKGKMRNEEKRWHVGKEASQRSEKQATEEEETTLAKNWAKEKLGLRGKKI